MPKRKRESEEHHEEIAREGHDMVSPVNDEQPRNRNEIFKEALRDMKLVQEAVRQAVVKMKEWYEQTDDYFSMKGVEYLTEASEIVEQGLTSLEQSNEHWVSFLCIPEVPMRHILKYLSFKDKANFRLSSGSHRDIVDCFDIQFKSNKIYLMSDDETDVGDFQEILRSGKDFKVHFADEINDTGEEILRQVSDRLVELKGPQDAIHCVESTAKKLEKITLKPSTGGSEYMPFAVSKFASSLKILELDSIYLHNLEDREFSLPYLEKLSLKNVASFKGLDNLLASCSSSLEELSIEDWGNSVTKRFMKSTLLLNLPDIKLNRLKKLNLVGFGSVTSLLRLTSDSLQDLKLKLVGQIFEPEHLDFSFPRLESLALEKSHPYLSILTCSLQRLKSLELDNIEMRSQLNYCLPNTLTQLSLKITCQLSEPGKEEMRKILVQSATHIEQLRFSCRDFVLNNSVPKFSKLKSASFAYFNTEIQADIANRSPMLKDLTISGLNNGLKNYVDNAAVEKLVVSTCLPTETTNGTFDIRCLFEKFSNLKDLCIKDISYFCYNNGMDQVNLTRLSLQYACKDISDVFNILNACSSTLQELKLVGNFHCHNPERQEIDHVKLKEMKSLKMITIAWLQWVDDCTTRDGSRYFKQLQNQCKKTLNRLAIFNQFGNEALQYLKLDLPNLKIFQVGPTRPPDEVMRHIASQLPKDVVYWFLPVDIRD